MLQEIHYSTMVCILHVIIKKLENVYKQIPNQLKYGSSKLTLRGKPTFVKIFLIIPQISTLAIYLHNSSYAFLSYIAEIKPD